jgi:hypothetical protein
MWDGEMGWPEIQKRRGDAKMICKGGLLMHTWEIEL